MKTNVKCKCIKLSEHFIIHCDAELSGDMDNPNLFRVTEVYSNTCPFYTQLHKCPDKNCVLADGDSFDCFSYDDPNALPY